MKRAELSPKSSVNEKLMAALRHENDLELDRNATLAALAIPRDVLAGARRARPKLPHSYRRRRSGRRSRRLIPATETRDSGGPNLSMESATGRALSGSVPSRTLTE